MNRIDVVMEGEKLGIEKKTSNDGKVINSLHILNGFESVKLGIKDGDLLKKLEEAPSRKPIKIKAEVGLYNGKMYAVVKEVIGF